MDKKTVTYYSEGHVIVADLYTPEGFDETKRYPALVQCQGFSGIRDMMMEDFARFFTGAGFVCLAPDYRGWGDSGGERGRLAPLEQVDDIRNGLTFLQAQPFVDGERLCAFGASFGGLIAPYVAAVDTRVKATVGMVGVADGLEAITNDRTPEEVADIVEKIAQARQTRVLSNHVERDWRVIDIFRDEQSAAWLPMGWEMVPKWRTKFSYESLGRVADFRPIDMVHKIAPRALGLIIATQDTCASPDSYRALHAAAGEPKQLWEYDCGHYDMYAGEPMETAINAAIAFFKEHVG